jgi:hypothetical protein
MHLLYDQESLQYSHKDAGTRSFGKYRWYVFSICCMRGRGCHLGSEESRTSLISQSSKLQLTID